MFCPKCGTEVPNDATFCTKCGNQLSGMKQAKIESEPEKKIKKKPFYKKVSFWIFAAMLLGMVSLLAKCTGVFDGRIATVERNDGTKETVTAAEICEIYNNEKILFDDQYLGAKVTIEGKVKAVNGATYYDGHYTRASIEIENGNNHWLVEASNTATVRDIHVGDKVEAKGNLFSAFISPEILIINGHNTSIEKIG